MGRKKYYTLGKWGGAGGSWGRGGGTGNSEWVPPLHPGQVAGRMGDSCRACHDGNTPAVVPPGILVGLRV